MNIKYCPRAVVCLFLAMCIGGCSNANDKPADNRATKAARLEAEFQEQTDPDGVMRTDASSRFGFRQ